jgi:hypothetical protein
MAITLGSLSSLMHRPCTNTWTLLIWQPHYRNYPRQRPLLATNLSTFALEQFPPESRMLLMPPARSFHSRF